MAREEIPVAREELSATREESSMARAQKPAATAELAGGHGLFSMPSGMQASPCAQLPAEAAELLSEARFFPLSRAQAPRALVLKPAFSETPDSLSRLRYGIVRAKIFCPEPSVLLQCAP